MLLRIYKFYIFWFTNKHADVQPQKGEELKRLRGAYWVNWKEESRKEQNYGRSHRDEEEFSLDEDWKEQAFARSP